MSKITENIHIKWLQVEVPPATHIFELYEIRSGILSCKVSKECHEFCIQMTILDLQSSVVWWNKLFPTSVHTKRNRLRQVRWSQRPCHWTSASNPSMDELLIQQVSEHKSPVCRGSILHKLEMSHIHQMFNSNWFNYNCKSFIILGFD